MTKNQYVNWRNKQKFSVPARFAAGGIFLAIVAGFGVLWASARGDLDLTRWMGVCGFKQRFNLPCPGCGWTHAAQMFVTGHPVQAFVTQPAAGVFCVVFLLTAVFALHCAVFGINFPFLQRLFSSKGLCLLLAGACFVIIAGWMVTLIRAILENSGY